MNVGANIRKARISKGMKQKELAEELGKTPQSIQNYENGRRTPWINDIADIAKILNVDVFELLGQEKEIKTPTVTLQDYTTDELLKELFRRVGGSL